MTGELSTLQILPSKYRLWAQACTKSGRPAATGDRRETSKTTLELLDDIEEGELDIQNIFIEPPDVNLYSDEDSGDEDGGGLVDNLSARQLQAPAQAVLANGLVLGEDDKDEEEEDGEEDFQRTTKHRSTSIPHIWTEVKHAAFTLT